MRWMLPVRRGVSGKLHLHRSRRKHRRQPHLRWRTLRESLQHRLFAVYLLRILCRSLPHRRNYARPRLRASPVQHKLADLQKRETTRKRHPEELQNRRPNPSKFNSVGFQNQKPRKSAVILRHNDRHSTKLVPKFFEPTPFPRWPPTGPKTQKLERSGPFISPTKRETRNS